MAGTHDGGRPARVDAAHLGVRDALRGVRPRHGRTARLGRKAGGVIARITLLTMVAGFAVGTTTHTLQLIEGGWLPDYSAPLWLNAYWTALTFLDPLAVVLLLTRLRAGLLLAVTIMLSNVAINSYAAYVLNFGFGWSLQLQSLFGGFVLGAAGFLWSSSGAVLTLYRRRIV